MIRLPKLSEQTITLGAILALVASVAGFQAIQTLPLNRFILLALTILALTLALSGRDKLFLTLLTIYSGSALLTGLLLTETLPVWVVFPAGFVLVTLTAAYLFQSGEKEDYAAALGAGFLLVELTWFLSLWPFDPQSKAAIITLFFYALWLLILNARREGQISLKDWLAGAVWLSIILFFVIWFAEWRI